MATKPTYLSAALRHLRKADPVLGGVIADVGPCRLTPAARDTFEALLESIVYQQLNGKAAATIHGRVVAALGGELSPARLRRTPDAPLRGAGLSANKLAAARDLADKCLSGVVPPRRRLEPLPDAEIVARLTQVRGVGEWTAQMFLMFNLARPDVLPAADFGLRKAFGLLYRKNGRLPPPAALERHGRAWAPYRTVASWYLWRRLDTPGRSQASR
ncbi:MAG: DNA-3-methyladenine glycosylase 2 family protein [Elusimicrobia bacterium]|nr:DNA-3-methyladenine glycosylase 2 family protein [Elusimicrobiota bacterium]